MSTIRQMFNISSTVSRQGFIAGMECEIENLRSTNAVNRNIWNVVEDGSLRNDGMEFVTAVPSTRSELMEQFCLLQKSLVFHGKDSTKGFGERTSTHVHINCLDLEPHQVKSILHFYAMFEPLFFRMVSKNRTNNIHCVALSETLLSEYYRREVDQLVQRWSKYTALNLCPLATFGTIEFRHLQGTDDPAIVAEWLATLENLWTYGQANKINRKWFDNTSNLDKAFEAIFKDSSIIRLAPYINTLIQDSLTDVKLTFH